VSNIKKAKQALKVRLNDIPKVLIKLGEEAIQTWCLVILHLREHISHFLPGERRDTKGVIHLGDLGVVIHLGLVKRKVFFLPSHLLFSDIKNLCNILLYIITEVSR
jgi:hypothetical protein